MIARMRMPTSAMLVQCVRCLINASFSSTACRLRIVRFIETLLHHESTYRVTHVSLMDEFHVAVQVSLDKSDGSVAKNVSDLSKSDLNEGRKNKIRKKKLKKKVRKKVKKSGKQYAGNTIILQKYIRIITKVLYHKLLHLQSICIIIVCIM